MFERQPEPKPEPNLAMEAINAETERIMAQIRQDEAKRLRQKPDELARREMQVAQRETAMTIKESELESIQQELDAMNAESKTVETNLRAKVDNDIAELEQTLAKKKAGALEAVQALTQNKQLIIDALKNIYNRSCLEMVKQIDPKNNAVFKVCITRCPMKEKCEVCKGKLAPILKKLGIDVEDKEQRNKWLPKTL